MIGVRKKTILLPLNLGGHVYICILTEGKITEHRAHSLSLLVQTRFEVCEGAMRIQLYMSWKLNEDGLVPQRIVRHLLCRNSWRCGQGEDRKMCVMLTNKPPSVFRVSCLLSALRQETINTVRLVSAGPPHAQHYWFYEMTPASTAGSELGLMTRAVLYRLKRVSMTPLCASY